MIAAIATYQTSDPTLDSQIVALQASGADVLFDNTRRKFAAQAIRKIYDVGWKPLHLLTSVSTSVTAVLWPAGFEKSQGLITAAYLKDPNDLQWADDPA
jgi:branched-chain amino acid transport system substrate-binding protein